VATRSARSRWRQGAPDLGDGRLRSFERAEHDINLAFDDVGHRAAERRSSIVRAGEVVDEVFKAFQSRSQSGIA
jgi:hypothetical protein